MLTFEAAALVNDDDGPGGSGFVPVYLTRNPAGIVAALFPPHSQLQPLFMNIYNLLLLPLHYLGIFLGIRNSSAVSAYILYIYIYII